MQNIAYSTTILDAFLRENKFDKIAVLTDQNTSLHCLPILQKHIPYFSEIRIPAGEENKSLDTCKIIWDALFALEASRNSLLINLGGGVATDIGSFAASVFKRGISVINIPTSLLAMVDASIGAKTAINNSGYKNSIGSFYDPKLTVIDQVFLKTLDKRQLKSGFVEMLKHGIIANRAYFKELLSVDLVKEINWDLYIQTSIEIKSKIVAQDPTEKGLRKILNFGHSIGHALESYGLEIKTPWLHGEAVLYGMIAALYLSTIKFGYQSKLLAPLEFFAETNLGRSKIDFNAKNVMQYLKHDKKNNASEFLFVLIDSNDQLLYDCSCTESEIEQALNYIHAKN